MQAALSNTATPIAIAPPTMRRMAPSMISKNCAIA